MEITLEKIELVKDRTGVTYAESKAALEEAEGSVVDAIIAIEETINAGEKKRGFGKKGEALFASLKDLVKKGNVAKIQVKRNEEIVLNVPVNAGIVGIVIAPIAAVVAVVAAFGFKCTIEVIKDDGTVVDVSDAMTDAVGTVVEKSSTVAGEMREKGADIYQKGKEKGAEIYQKGKEKASDAIEKMKKGDDEDIAFTECFEETAQQDDTQEDAAPSEGSTEPETAAEGEEKATEN